jgi:hypothetical protein
MNPFDNIEAHVVTSWWGEDGHQYSRLDDGSIGHVDCWCLNKTDE